MIDLRSDTVTVPDAGMRKVMAGAEVGDDVFGEDPSVNRLQEVIANLLGFEAGLFLPSGHMCNQVAIASHTQRGDEVIVADNSHVFNYESGTASVFSGIQLSPVLTTNGRLAPESIAAAKREGHDWEARTKLVCLENTVNKAGGITYSLESTESIADACRLLDLDMHLDGARLWNAAVALDESPATLSRRFDSVSVCLSKGLGAPVGSVLVGGKNFIRRARRFRKMMGGGMRQAGVLAAAGMYALENNFERLVDDHRRAQILANGIADRGYPIDLTTVESNIVMFDVPDQTAIAFVTALREKNVGLIPFGPHTIRATLHWQISDADVESVLNAIPPRTK